MFTRHDLLWPLSRADTAGNAYVYNVMVGGWRPVVEGMEGLWKL
jgi:hypothetical protein